MNKLLLAILIAIPAPILASEQTYLEMQAYCKASPQGCANRLYMAYVINSEVIAEVYRLDRQVRRLKQKLAKCKKPS